MKLNTKRRGRESILHENLSIYAGLSIEGSVRAYIPTVIPRNLKFIGK